MYFSINVQAKEKYEVRKSGVKATKLDKNKLEARNNVKVEQETIKLCQTWAKV